MASVRSEALSRLGRFTIALSRDEISRGPAMARRFRETTPMLDYFIAE
jgi:hypothetical protein